MKILYKIDFSVEIGRYLLLIYWKLSIQIERYRFQIECKKFRISNFSRQRRNLNFFPWKKIFCFPPPSSWFFLGKQISTNYSEIPLKLKPFPSSFLMDTTRIFFRGLKYWEKYKKKPTCLIPHDRLCTFQFADLQKDVLNWLKMSIHFQKYRIFASLSNLFAKFFKIKTTELVCGLGTDAYFVEVERHDVQ